MTARTISVPGISCEHCQTSIEQAVGDLAGVEAVAVDIAARTVDLSYDESAVGLDQIIQAIEDVGYDVAP
jgi:copper chaperone